MTRSRRISRGVVVLFALLSSGGIAGCGGGDDGGTGPETPTAPELVAQGWTSFEAGDFAGARSKFQEALALDPSLAEGMLGLGWSDTFLGNLPAAQTELALVADDPVTPANAELVHAAFAGLSVVRLALDNAAGAITAGQSLLSADANWTFAHRSSVTAADVRLAMAEAYVTQGAGSFDEAQAQLDILDPTNGLDPSDSATWLVAGVTYPSYEGALIRALQEVEAQLGETSLFGARGQI